VALAVDGTAPQNSHGCDNRLSCFQLALVASVANQPASQRQPVAVHGFWVM